MSFVDALRALAGMTAEETEVAGVRCLVVRDLSATSAVETLRQTRASLPSGVGAILTDPGLVHEDYEDAGPIERCTLAAARYRRRRAVMSSRGAARVLRAIAHARPQSKRYDERDSFLELSEPRALMIVEGSWVDAVRLFTPDGGGSRPSNPETIAFLDHWRERFGAIPLFADGARLELELSRPPRTLRDLRAAARDAFLLSQGVREGIGLERPGRLLRRLASDRWVIWWYGT